MRGLSPAQRAAYERDGTLFPLPAIGADDAARYRAVVEKLVGLTQPAAPLGQTHLFFAELYALAAHPAILDIVADVIGPDILVHSTTIFAKWPGDEKYVSWHQDGHYWALDEPRLTSAWIALSDSASDNGCLRVVPGSHRTRLPHESHKDERNLLTTGLEIAVAVDDAQALDVVLQPGQVSLHHVNMVHSSNANRSDRPRIGFAVRYVSPFVQQTREHHAVLHVRGRADGTRYTLAAPPRSGLDEGMAAFDAFRRNGGRAHA